MFTFGILYFIACGSDKAVTVFNSPPEADIISHQNDAEVFEGYPVEFRAALSDPNHDTDQLTARWLVNGLEVCPSLPPESNGDSVCVATINAGEEEVSVEVRDPENSSSTSFVTLKIIPTEPPAAEIISPEENGIFYSDYIITFEGKISDPEDAVEDLQFEWKSNLDDGLHFETEVESDGTILGFGYLTEGQHAITLRVEDTTGKSTSANTTVNVGGPNSNPTCEIITPTSGTTFPVGETIAFEALANDNDIDNNLLHVEWISDKMEDPLGSSTPNSSGDVAFTYSDLSIDSHTVTMTVSDEKGATCSDFIIVTIGTPPSVVIDSPTIGTYNEGEDITFSATVSDNEDLPNEIALEWTTSDGTTLNTQSATSDGHVEFVLNDLSYGQQMIHLTATDTDGLTASGLISFTINALPTQPSLIVLPQNPKTEDDILATATDSTDADGGNITYSYEWVHGSTTINGSNLSFSETIKDQEWTVTATPNDGIADGPSVSQTVTIQNTTPTDLIVSITPNSTVYNNSELTCLATANDIDINDTLEYTYEWSTGETTETIILDGSLNPTDTLTCVASVSDGVDSISDSADLILENRDPELSNMIIEADGLWNGTTLTCSADVTDEDGETPEISYIWTLTDGTTIVESNILVLENVSNGDVFNCSASTEDGYGGNDTISESITITNTLPIIDSIEVTPQDVLPNEHTFTCNVESSDDDGDDVTVSYVWTIDGDIQPETSHQLDGLFDLGMVVACHATPNDGKEDGIASTDSTEIINTQPIVDSITLHPSVVYTNDMITTTTLFSDPDVGHTVSGAYEWHVVDIDGNDVIVQSGTDNTLSGIDYFDKDEEVFVVVTPNDGFEDGSPVTSNSVVISNTIPTIDTIEITPNPAIAIQDDLTCTVTGSDDDGDDLTFSYVWTDGEGVEQQTNSEVQDDSDTFLGSGTMAGSWTCEVTPFDGDDDGDPNSSVVEITSGCSSLQFDGVDDVIVIGEADNLLGLTNAFTLCSWIYPDSYPSTASYGLIDFEGTRSSNPNYNSGISLELEQDGRIRAHYGTGTFSNESDLISNSSLPTGEWTHVCFTRDQGDIKVYINGIEDATTILPADNLSFEGNDYETDIYQLGLYSRAGATHPYYEGKLSQISVWDIALGSADVSSIYDGDDISTIQPNNSIVHWALNEGQGSTAYDGVSSFDGQIEGGALWADTCPQEDNDEDGVWAYQDCDDQNSDVTDGVTGASANCAATSCLDILNEGYSLGNGIYWISASSPVQTYCDMETDGGGWTLISSFVNTDGNVMWSRPVGDTHWRTASTFGNVNTPTSSDYKSILFSELFADDILLQDPYGWLSFDSVLNQETFLDLMLGYNSCQTVPLVDPGSSTIDSSSPTYKSGAMLTLYAGDPNYNNTCSFSGAHNDSTFLAIGGMWAGTIGAGQWGTNYNSGMDWHANFDNNTVCINCDTGGWYGYDTVTSSQHANNSGHHNNSQWGTLYIR